MTSRKAIKHQEIIEAMSPMIVSAPWVLTIKEEKKITGPVLVIKERREAGKGGTKLYSCGKIYGGDLRACKDAIRYMTGQVKDGVGRPLRIHELIDDKIEFRGDIPLDNSIGSKMALLFKLHPQIRNEKRIELLAWRIERFSYEESQYWLGKVSLPIYGKRSMEWAKSGLRLMLAGQTEDMKEIEELLDQLRK